jgi:hypothetical protein
LPGKLSVEGEHGSLNTEHLNNLSMDRLDNAQCSVFNVHLSTQEDFDLFTDHSLWTMIHGIVLGGAALMGLFTALFSILVMRTAGATGVAAGNQSLSFARLTTFIAVALWLTVLVGTYIIFPPYRATPPEGATDLTRYPRSLILANPETAWLHAFAMESKEQLPWIASMLATAVAFVAVRYRSKVLNDTHLNSMTATLLAICLVLVAFMALLGVVINKAAPLR